MAADADTNAGRNFCRRNFYDVITEGCIFSTGDGNRCKWQKKTISTDDLHQSSFIYIFRVDFIVVNNGTQTRTGKGNFGMRILLL